MESEVSAWDALSDRGRSDQHWMDDIGHNFVDSGLAEQMEGSSCGLGGKREMMIPEWVRQSADPFGDLFESRR